MRKREIKLPITPITESTFIRQGWKKNIVGDELDPDEETGVDSVYESTNEAYYYTLPVPKDRNDEYTPMLVSNATDERGFLKDIGLNPNTFFVELLGTDGLGRCVSEEELEILYRVLTGEDIE